MTFQIKTIGILGGDARACMAALAAARLGVRVCAYTEAEHAPIAQIVPFTFVGRFTDREKLKSFAESVDAITYTEAGVLPETLRFLQKFKPVYPDDHAFETAQDRLKRKKFLNAIGMPTARWAAVHRANDITKAMEDLGLQAALLKPVNAGDDSARWISINAGEDPKAAWKTLGEPSAILEELIEFSCEISVTIARDVLGQTALYGPTLNEHRHHALTRCTTPAPIPPELAERARNMAQLLAEAIGLIGVLCLELYVLADGRLLAGAVTPHPHDSANWTIEACTCSQYEQQIRTVTGMLTGSPNRHSDAITVMLHGPDIIRLNYYLEKANASLHLYGISSATAAGRIGHVTMIEPMKGKNFHAIPHTAPHAGTPEIAPAEGKPKGAIR